MTKHTQSKLKVIDHYLTTDNDPEGELVIAIGANHVNPISFAAPVGSLEDAANLARLALAWNCHQDLVEALTALHKAAEEKTGETVAGNTPYALAIFQARSALAKVGGEK